MIISEAISKRIINLCDERNISINKLAIMSGLTQSTLHSIVSMKSKNPKLLTIVRVCDSFKMELKGFFNDKLFKDLDNQL